MLHTTSTQSRRRRHNLMPHLLVLCVALFTLDATSQVGATVVVNDPQSMLKAVKEYAEQAQRWSQTVSQYQMQLAHYQQQLIKLQKLDFGQSTMVTPFTERDREHGVENACPGSQPGFLSQLMNTIQQPVPNMQGNLIDEQRTLCQLMVVAENDRYNESVRMLKRLVERNQQFAQIQQQRANVGDSQGSLAANDNEVQRFTAQNSLDLDHWQATMTAYDAYIATLREDQSRLARRALGGNRDGKPLVGQVIQAAALKAALSVD